MVDCDLIPSLPTNQAVLYSGCEDRTPAYHPELTRCGTLSPSYLTLPAKWSKIWAVSSTSALCPTRWEDDAYWLEVTAVQSPNYDSTDISGVSGCQRHIRGLSSRGRAARGQSIQQKTSRDSPVQWCCCFSHEARLSRAVCGTCFTSTELDCCTSTIVLVLLDCWWKAVPGTSPPQSEMTRLWAPLGKGESHLGGHEATALLCLSPGLSRDQYGTLKESWVTALDQSSEALVLC